MAVEKEVLCYVRAFIYEIAVFVNLNGISGLIHHLSQSMSRCLYCPFGLNTA